MIRNTFYLAALSILLLTVAGQPGWVASFDCAKAETANEKAICADRQLNDDDVEMSVLYSQLKPLPGLGARGDLDDEQGAWLKRRAGCGDDRAIRFAMSPFGTGIRSGLHHCARCMTYRQRVRPT